MDARSVIEFFRGKTPQKGNGLYYHGSFDRIDKFQPLSHFGSPQVACNRVDDVFLRDRVDPKKMVRFRDARLYEVTLDIKNPLRVIDAWGSGFIGNAGSELFKKFQKASPDEIRNVLLPTVRTEQYLAAKEICYVTPIETLKQEMRNDGIVPTSTLTLYENEEFILRELAVSNRFTKLAKKHGYDGLVYGNTQEARDQDCLINFTPEQVHLTGRVFALCPTEDIPHEQKLAQTTMKRDGKYDHIQTAAYLLKATP